MLGWKSVLLSLMLERGEIMFPLDQMRRLHEQQYSICFLWGQLGLTFCIFCSLSPVNEYRNLCSHTHTHTNKTPLKFTNVRLFVHVCECVNSRLWQVPLQRVVQRWKNKCIWNFPVVRKKWDHLYLFVCCETAIWIHKSTKGIIIDCTILLTHSAMNKLSQAVNRQ